MAGFDIQSPTTLVVLRRSRDGTAIGEASFTVANQTGHAVRVRATVVPEGPTDLAWFAFAEPGSERNFGKDQSDTFVILITVPASAPEGDHHFRLDAVSVTMPDEEWGRGNSVRFHVPEISGEEPQEEEEPGYIETVGGALGGAIAVGTVLLLIGLLVGVIAGENDLAKALLGFILAVLGAVLGGWVGPIVGSYLLLRFRGFRDPWSTALPMVVLVPLIGLPLLAIWGAIIGAIDADVIEQILLVITVILGVGLPALAARAIFRWRTLGHL